MVKHVSCNLEEEEDLISIIVTAKGKERKVDGMI
jgi:hypothetical protein